MIEFPEAPAVGDTVTSPDGITWKWDGATWVMSPRNSTWKEAVSTATTHPVPLSGLDTIDNTTVVEGDRILVKDQHFYDPWGTGNQENGIYIASAGAWTRAPDCADAAAMRGAVVSVIGAFSGTGAYNNTIWIADRPSSLADTWVNFVPLNDPDAYQVSGIQSTKTVEMSDYRRFFDVNGGATITLPDPTSFPMGFEATFARNTSAAVSFVAGVAGTVSSAEGMMAIAHQGGVASIKRIGFYTPVWVLFGDLG